MKITSLNMETYRWKRAKPIRNGMYVYPTAGLNVVKVETDEGVTGVGLAGGVQGAEEIGKAILDHFAQVVVGQDPFDTEKIWDDLWQPKLVGRRGITTRVISGIDIALWDLKGKAHRTAGVQTSRWVHKQGARVHRRRLLRGGQGPG